MAIGLVGRKSGMTRVFTEDGLSIPVTVIEVLPNRVTQIKSVEKDGYAAIQVTYDTVKNSRVNKPKAGHFAKANVDAGLGLTEFRLDDVTDASFELGQVLQLFPWIASNITLSFYHQNDL